MNAVVAFDLDDTLYPEYDFVVSGYRAVAELLPKHDRQRAVEVMLQAYDDGVNPFDALVAATRCTVPIADMVAAYRYHKPTLRLEPTVRQALQRLADAGVGLALITDGRTTTQRNKIESLGLDEFFGSQVYISEAEGVDKTSAQSFERVMATLPAERYAYVGDNPAKDFAAPNRLGWLTVCLRGTDRNVHPQDIEVGEQFRPKATVDRIADVCDLILK
ncbi:MAG: HAD family hydrolase [Candidatus Limisoma sp.]